MESWYRRVQSWAVKHEALVWWSTNGSGSFLWCVQHKPQVKTTWNHSLCSGSVKLQWLSCKNGSNCFLIEPQNYQTRRFKPDNEFRNTSAIVSSCPSTSTSVFNHASSVSWSRQIYLNNKFVFSNTLLHCLIHVFGKWQHGDWKIKPTEICHFSWILLSKTLFICVFLHVFGLRMFKFKDIQSKCHIYCPPLSLHTSEATSDCCLLTTAQP